jgi:hypothetical protein
VAGIDFALTPVRLARVSGIATDSRGQLLEDGFVSVSHVDDEEGGFTGGSMQGLRKGQFTVEGLAPGDYTIGVMTGAPDDP